jgi:hypothetical protein
MAQAKRVHSTPRKTASKKPTSKKAAPKDSAIIKECVKYVQSVAAYKAGFDADADDCEIAGAGGVMGKAALESAEAAMFELLASWPKRTVTVHEMKALAAVFETLMMVDAQGSVLTDMQREFVEFFARAANEYFKQAAAMA